MTRVFINGIDGLLGARVAELLSTDPDTSIIGLGRTKPPAPIGRAEFLKARLSGRQLVELLRAEQVEVVIHLDFVGAERPAANREEAVQLNVLGTMELLGASATAGVRRVVLRSHTFVYGASSLNPTFISEERPATSAGVNGLVRHFTEVERFVAEFSARRTGIVVSPIRCAPLVGAWSPLTDYLRQPTPRMLVGFDPCLQLLHLEDAATGFALAALSTASGAFNLASEDTLCLSQAIRLAGQRPAALLEPVVNAARAMGNRDILGDWPYDISFMRHSCVADTTRARCELGWCPTFSAVDCVHSIGAAGQNGNADPSREAAEEALRTFLARRS